MTNKQWTKEIAALLSAPGLSVLNRERRIRAAKIIGTVYGPRRRKAASSCIDTMFALIKLSNEYATVENKTQPEIGRHCKLSGNMVGQYTRFMENVGLIEVERNRRVQTGRKKGQFTSNRYILLFLKDKSKEPHPINECSDPRQFYRVGAGRVTAPT